jgi:hypothetical protein
MTTGPAHWINKLFEMADAGLQKLNRPCPKCGGSLHRRFSLLDKIGLYFPLPHTIYAKHECEQCHAHFRSYRCLTDLFLEAGWLLGLYSLGRYWPLALAGTVTWMVAWFFAGREASRGEFDTVGAGIVLGIVWMLALMFGDMKRGAYLESHSVIMFLLMTFLVIVPPLIVLFLDRYTNFHLEECD